MEPVLTLKNISAHGEDRRALLSGTDLTVLPGERVRVAAERPRFQALARVIGGLIAPERGEIRLLGRPLGAWPAPERAARMGHMPLEPGFWEDMTVLQNAALPLMASGASRREREAAALAVLKRLGIGYAAHLYPEGLGLCERRLAALARALVTGPELLILTDPTSMLNEKETERFANALGERWETEKFAVLYCGAEIIPADKTIYLDRGEGPQ